MTKQTTRIICDICKNEIYEKLPVYRLSIELKNPNMVNPQQGLTIEDISRIGEKSGKVMMIHGFNPEYAGQKRGYSRIGFALQELKNLTDFSLAIIKKARFNHRRFCFECEKSIDNFIDKIIQSRRSV